MTNLKHVRSLAIVSLILLCTVGGAAAQGRDRDRDRDGRRNRAERQWGSEEMPRAGVCLFENADFGGRHFCIAADDDLDKMPRDMRDKVSSLRIIGNVGAVVFRDEKFKGPSGRFMTDVRNLQKQGWNDQISSVRVTTTASAWDGTRLPRWGRAAIPREGACFYRDVKFKGDYFCVARGGSHAELPDEFNDQISSIRLIRAAGVLLFVDRDFEGRSGTVKQDVADLRRGVWSDRISSFRVF